jgi:hypothetical protein
MLCESERKLDPNMLCSTSFHLWFANKGRRDDSLAAHQPEYPLRL